MTVKDFLQSLKNFPEKHEMQVFAEGEIYPVKQVQLWKEKGTSILEIGCGWANFDLDKETMTVQDIVNKVIEATDNYNLEIQVFIEGELYPALQMQLWKEKNKETVEIGCGWQPIEEEKSKIDLSF